MVLLAVVNCIIVASGHLKGVSAIKTNIFPRNGHGKSACICSHGDVGQVHGCSGTLAGKFLLGQALHTVLIHVYRLIKSITSSVQAHKKLFIS